MSVRFGVKNLVIDDSGGSPENHDKGIEIDSKERIDEFTKDGDKDMEMHFKTDNAGLEIKDIEACIKGKFTNVNENIFTFFGCGSVDIQKDISTDGDGGCLIATAAYGTELAPQVQFLREIRDNTVLTTASGSAFMTGFNTLYYSFAPTVADMERENPMFQDAVRVFITPMISTLSIMSLAENGSEAEVL